jgi:membrane-associated phospholipid phosphatase
MLWYLQGTRVRLRRYARLLLSFGGTCALWLLLLRLRPMLMQPKCMESPEICDPSLLNPLDQAAWLQGSDVANALSDVTQNTSALVGLAFPWLFTLRPRRLGRCWFSEGVETTWAFLMASTTNGICSEVFHLLTQRPRPFVLSGALTRFGQDFAHYASMYSGHTSFVTLVWSFILVRSQDLSVGIKFLIHWLGFAFVFLTGLLRILAAKHYVSDVLVGSLFGAFFGAVFGEWDYRRAKLSR